jgi:PiT family inorganic phosphate transporter
VASSVVGVGLGRSWTRLRWRVVREMLMAWVLTLPACAAMGAVLDVLWRRFT